jgi:hypothetical protein
MTRTPSGIDLLRQFNMMKLSSDLVPESNTRDSSKNAENRWTVFEEDIHLLH